MTEMTDEEKRLLEGARRRPARTETPKPAAEPAPVARGPHSPVQFADDGWDQNTPVQMRS